MVSYERILWSHMRGYYGLIREDTMVSYERILWSHMRGYYTLMGDPVYNVYIWSLMSRSVGSSEVFTEVRQNK